MKKKNIPISWLQYRLCIFGWLVLFVVEIPMELVQLKKGQ